MRLLPLLVILLSLQGLAAQKPLRLGIYEKAIAAADPGDITIVLNSLLDQIQLGKHKMVATRYSTRADFIRALKSGEIDLVPLETYQYLDFSQEEPLEVVAAPIIDGNDPRIRFLLLTHVDHEKHPLKDIGGKTIAIDQRWQTPIPTHWLDYHLRKSGTSTVDFKKVSYEKKPSQPILSVFIKQQDLCVTTAPSFEMMAELNPQIKAKLRIVTQSPPYHLFVLCVRQSMDESAKKRLKEQLTHLHSTEAGRQLLLLSQSQRLGKVEAEDLKNIRELVEFTKRSASSRLPAITNHESPDS